MVKKAQKHEPTLHDVLAVLGLIQERLAGIEDTQHKTGKRLFELENKMDEALDTLEDITSAISNHTLSITHHGKRLARLERSAS